MLLLQQEHQTDKIDSFAMKGTELPAKDASDVIFVMFVANQSSAKTSLSIDNVASLRAPLLVCPHNQNTVHSLLLLTLNLLSPTVLYYSLSKITK